MTGMMTTHQSTATARPIAPARVVSCAEHGPSAWCYIQADGSHVDSARCRCWLLYDPSCPVDAHRDATIRATHVSARRPR